MCDTGKTFLHVSELRTYLESRITLKIAKTHISPRAKNPLYQPNHPHVTHISPRAKKPYHLTFLLDQMQSIPYRYVIRIFVWFVLSITDHY